MTCERQCDQQRQPCPSPYLCGTGCYFNEATATTDDRAVPTQWFLSAEARETSQDKAAGHFWEPNAALHIEAYAGPTRLQRVLDWLGNLPHRFGLWVDRTNAGRLFCLSFGGICACVLVAFAVVP